MKSLRVWFSALTVFSLVACAGQSASNGVTPQAAIRHVSDATGNLVDGGFESGAFGAWQNCKSVSASITSSKAHTGTFSAFMGTTASPELNGDSGVCQQVTIPAGGTLSFFVFQGTNETNTQFAWQEADLLDSSGNVVTNFYKTATTTSGWVQKSFDVSSFAGQSLTLYFGVHGNGFKSDFINQFVDDVALSGSSTATPSPTSSPTSSPTPKPTATPTHSPSPSPTPTHSPSPSPTPTHTASPTPTPTPKPTATPTPAATPSGGPTPIATPSGQGSQSCGTSCGVERWHIKTLDDGFTNTINWTPTPISVTTLIGMAVPSNFSTNNDTTRYAPVETTVYTIRAVLVGWKTESDQDFHIVIADPNNSSNTMIIEPPDSTCSDACASNFGNFYSAVRTKLTNCFGQVPSSFTNFKAGIVVDVTGVGFFDALHGQTGVAPNGVELHPLLNVNFVSGVTGC